MNNEFIPYEQALELKELGFDDNCFGCYLSEENKQLTFSICGPYQGIENCIKAPLYQQAFRWFRNEKLLDGSVYRYQDKTDGGVYYSYDIICDLCIKEIRFNKNYFYIYEEAELACLKKLIEIVKNK